MIGWGTIIKNSSGETICFGWITRNPNNSTSRFFEGFIVEEDKNHGFPDNYTIPVRLLRAFLNAPALKDLNLGENVYGPLTGKPFDPQFVLDNISDLNDDDNIIIEEWDEG